MYLVWQADVDEALRLMRMSKVSLLESGSRAEQRDPVSLVYEALRDDAQRSGKQTYTWADLTTLLGHKFSVRAAHLIRSSKIDQKTANHLLTTMSWLLRKRHAAYATMLDAKAEPPSC